MNLTFIVEKRWCSLTPIQLILIIIPLCSLCICMKNYLNLTFIIENKWCSLTHVKLILVIIPPCNMCICMQSYPCLTNSCYNLFVFQGERETLLLKKQKKSLRIINNSCRGLFFVRSHVSFVGGVTLLGPDLFWGGQPRTRYWATQTNGYWCIFKLTKQIKPKVLES